MGLATVRVDAAPIYEKATVESACLDEMLYGMSVQVIEQSDTGWCYVRSEYQTEGYMPTSYLLVDATVAAAWRKYKKVVVLAPYIDVQRAPAPAAPRLAGLPRGGILVTLAGPGEDGWQKVGLADGTVGYTRASYLGDAITDWASLAEDDMRWNIVETALSYNGAAWRSGGRTPQGIDAVGLAAMSYLLNGVIIPRSLGFRQGGILHQVSQKAMNEGDLIFFGGSIGVYMGDDKFVHATDVPGGEGVVVSSLRPRDDDYRGDLAGNILGVAGIY